MPRWQNALRGGVVGIALAAIMALSSASAAFAQKSTGGHPVNDAPNTGTNANTGRTAESYEEGKYGYVTLSGTISKVLDNDRFLLDYKNGVTQVDCDDALHELLKKAGHRIKAGDKVTVTGKIDDHWFTKREILISSILHVTDDYVVLFKRRGTGVGDAVPAIVGVVKPALFLEGEVALTGIVSRVSYGGKFTLRYQDGTIEVDASHIRIPGSSQIVPGDIVTVYGKIDNSFFNNRAIDAETIEKIGVYSRNLPDGQ